MSEEMVPYQNNGDDEGNRLAIAKEKIDGWKNEKSAVSNIVQNELGLLKTVLMASAYEDLKEHLFWRMCSFCDEEEALDHVAAYHEAKELGMDTDLNINFIFALCSANRQINHSNLVSEVLGSISSFHYTTNERKDRKGRSGDAERGPLSG